MINLNSITSYPIFTMLVKKGKRSFENIGRVLKKSGDTIRRILRPGDESLDASRKIAQRMFAKKKELAVIIDHTSVDKVYSKVMEGVFWYFDTKIGRCIRSYKLLVATISDGKFNIPISSCFSFGKEFYPDPKEALESTVKFYVETASNLFPGVKLNILLDGAFATVSILKWALESKRRLQARMHSNRVVEFEGKKQKLRDIKKLRPKGRQMARTVKVLWQGLSLYITAVRRIDKHDNETIAFQVATYKDLPSVHAKHYKIRWNIEKTFRTTKQSLGLQECFSTKILTQYQHICAVLLAYSIAQLEMKKKNYKNPETALRALDKKNSHSLNRYIHVLDRDILHARA